MQALFFSFFFTSSIREIFLQHLLFFTAASLILRIDPQLLDTFFGIRNNLYIPHRSNKSKEYLRYFFILPTATLRVTIIFFLCLRLPWINPPPIPHVTSHGNHKINPRITPLSCFVEITCKSSHAYLGQVQTLPYLIDIFYSMCIFHKITKAR